MGRSDLLRTGRAAAYKHRACERGDHKIRDHSLRFQITIVCALARAGAAGALIQAFGVPGPDPPLDAPSAWFPVPGFWSVRDTPRSGQRRKLVEDRLWHYVLAVRTEGTSVGTPTNLSP